MAAPAKMQELMDFMLQLRGMKLAQMGTAAQQSAYDSAVSEYGTSMDAWEGRAAEYDSAMSDYSDVLMPQYESTLAGVQSQNQGAVSQYETDRSNWDTANRNYEARQLGFPDWIHANYRSLGYGEVPTGNAYAIESQNFQNRYGNAPNPGSMPNAPTLTPLPENPYDMPTNNPGAPPSFEYQTPDLPHASQIAKLQDIAKQRQTMPQRTAPANPYQRYAGAYARYQT